MTKQITLEEALKIVSFYHRGARGWQVGAVKGDVYANVSGDVGGDVIGNVYGDVVGNITGDINGDVRGNVEGAIHGDVDGNVTGKINGREWKYVETPKKATTIYLEEKLQRLITESGNQELIEAFNQLEDN